MKIDHGSRQKKTPNRISTKCWVLSYFIYQNFEECSKNKKTGANKCVHISLNYIASKKRQEVQEIFDLLRPSGLPY